MSFKIGAHVSISGGYQNAVLEAEEETANCGQIFTHSPRMWAVPLIRQDQAAEFKRLREEKGIGPWMSHASYLMNCASGVPKIWHASVSLLKKELEAAGALGLEYLVMHPGSSVNGGGPEKLIRAINETKDVAENVTLLIENMAGAGGVLCKTFEQVKEILDSSRRRNIGTCMDTCHTFASGYDISTEEGLKSTVKIIKETIGVDAIKMIHLNDSKFGLGEKKDRHEHIGLGKIGEDGMRNILNHRDLKKIPFILETPYDSTRTHKDNIRVARKLAGAE